MEDILDHEPVEKNKKFASIMAFAFAMVSLMILATMFLKTAGTIETGDTLSSLYTYAIGLNVTVLFGFLFSIISLIRKEKIKYIKSIGIGVNMLLVLVVVGLVLFSRYMDGMGL